ncbi:MAG: histidinol-phosphate transaminase [Deltaproteobacteria bacterium]|nr:histidinol-phosphate transaminase [Deltaproteobacteria bacterium]
MKIEYKKNLLSIAPYIPGKPIKEVEKEYGIKNVVKLASNENSLGTSPKALEALQGSVNFLNRYPGHSALVEKLAQKYKVLPQNIVLGNGSDEILKMFAEVLLSEKDKAIMSEHCFGIYDIVVKSAGAASIFVPFNNFRIDLDAIKKNITSATKIIFLTNPNNPTGAIIEDKEFENFIKDIPQNILVIIDEAYIEFVRDKKNIIDSLNYIKKGYFVAVTRTFSKAYGLAGLRIGYSVMQKELASLLNRIRLPFNVNSLGEAAASAALDDKIFLNKSVLSVHNEIDFISAKLDEMKIEYLPTNANFLFINIKKNADKVFKEMLKLGVIVRSMKSYGYPEAIRVTIGMREENLKFLEAIEKVE